MGKPFQPLSVLGRLNRVRWYFRWPIKWAIFGLAYVAVCFPYPRLVVRHLSHWKDPSKLIQPDSPALAPLAADVRTLLAGKNVEIGAIPSRQLLNQVEAFVYDRVPYAWDWDTWGMADYLPTVEEVMTLGREDCDGRAVVAASLLRNLGYEARLVTDFAHVWVWTPHGETMGPGRIRTVEVTEKGIKVNARGLAQIPEILSYGIAVFPLPRELILLLVAWLLLLGRAGALKSFLALAIALCGLLVLRYGAVSYRSPRTVLQIVGAAGIVTAALMLALRRRTVEPARVPTTGNSL